MLRNQPWDCWKCSPESGENGPPAVDCSSVFRAFHWVIATIDHENTFLEVRRPYLHVLVDVSGRER